MITKLNNGFIYYTRDEIGNLNKFCAVYCGHEICNCVPLEIKRVWKLEDLLNKVRFGIEEIQNDVEDLETIIRGYN